VVKSVRNKTPLSEFGITYRTGQTITICPNISPKNTRPNPSVIQTYKKQNLNQKILKKLKLVPHPAKIDTNLTTNTQRRFVDE
jgi:hypothetical protein